MWMVRKRTRVTLDTSKFKWRICAWQLSISVSRSSRPWLVVNNCRKSLRTATPHHCHCTASGTDCVCRRKSIVWHNPYTPLTARRMPVAVTTRINKCDLIIHTACSGVARRLYTAVLSSNSRLDVGKELISLGEGADMWSDLLTFTSYLFWWVVWMSQWVSERADFNSLNGRIKIFVCKSTPKVVYGWSGTKFHKLPSHAATKLHKLLLHYFVKRLNRINSYKNENRLVPHKQHHQTDIELFGICSSETRANLCVQVRMQKFTY